MMVTMFRRLQARVRTDDLESMSKVLCPLFGQARLPLGNELAHELLRIEVQIAHIPEVHQQQHCWCEGLAAADKRLDAPGKLCLDLLHSLRAKGLPRMAHFP